MARARINARLIAAALAVGALASACDTDQPQTTAPPTTAAATRPDPLPVLVDYSPTVSDVGALMYLAATPDVDLRAVTLAGTGESRCAAAVPNTRALLALAGHDDVPVACGSVDPIGPGNEWPEEWRDAADALTPLELAAPSAANPEQADAAELIATTAASTSDLTIVALGPLTNLAEAVTDHPGLVDDVAMTYTMGGAVGVPGNAPGEAAEWNFYVDPTAVDVVVRSGLALTMVPLDATNYVPAGHGLYREMNDPRGNPAERVMLDLWTASIPWQNGFYLWDELTAIVAVDPSVAPVGTQAISVVTHGTEAGRTRPDAGGTVISVVGRPERLAVEREFLAGLAGLDDPADSP